jgi:NhaP-type Na+/H+ or K+/H+ antiporter
LPLLLFGEAMTLNWYYVKKVILPATLLAFLGAILGAFMIAISCRLIVSSEWSWILCWTFGAILSATDPVSVVALLKKLSLNTAPQMGLTYLIIGEALLNDGSGLVLFEALTEKTDIDPFTFFATKFTRVIFISPLVGIIIGYFTIILMRITNKRFSDEDATVQVALTVACAYGSFFCGQFFFKVSGVISCCAAGVILGWLSPPLILQKHNMHLIWSMFEWIGNSFIFILAGIAVGDKFWKYATMKEVGIIFIMYFICTFIRVAVLLICHFPVKYFLPEYTFREAGFTSFAGVRGAVGLAMVLVLEQHVVSNASSETMLNKIVFPDTDIESCVFIICGIITLTILINGTLAGEILLLLGVTSREISKEDEIILHYVKKRLKRTTRVQYENLELALPIHDKDLILKICTRLKPSKIANSSNSSTPFNSPPTSLKKDLFIKTTDIETTDIDIKLKGNNIQNQIHNGFDSTPIKDEIKDTSTLSAVRSLNFNVLSPSNQKGRSPMTNVSHMNSPPRLSSFNIVNDNTHINNLSSNSNGIGIISPKSNSFNLTKEQMAQIVHGNTNEQLSTQLSDNFLGIKREVEDELINELITNFRHKFLDVVRKSYYNQMHSGVLPRESNGN